MTVKNLIKTLSEYNENLNVCLFIEHMDEITTDVDCYLTDKFNVGLNADGNEVYIYGIHGSYM